RCTQIAAFGLALEAWKTGGYRQLPIPNIACSGISAAGRLEDWKSLADGDVKLESSLERMHTLFRDAGDLGSLVDPLADPDRDLLSADFAHVEPLLQSALKRESITDPAAAVFGNAATAASRAATLLCKQYTLVVTNPPFLARRHQGRVLTRFGES